MYATSHPSSGASEGVSCRTPSGAIRSPLKDLGELRFRHGDTGDEREPRRRADAGASVADDDDGDADRKREDQAEPQLIENQAGETVRQQIGKVADDVPGEDGR